jgi:hypothetical protein
MRLRREHQVIPPLDEYLIRDVRTSPLGSIGTTRLPLHLRPMPGRRGVHDRPDDVRIDGASLLLAMRRQETTNMRRTKEVLETRSCS